MKQLALKRHGLRLLAHSQTETDTAMKIKTGNWFFQTADKEKANVCGCDVRYIKAAKKFRHKEMLSYTATDTIYSVASLPPAQPRDGKAFFLSFLF